VNALLQIAPPAGAVVEAVMPDEYARLLGWPRHRPLTVELAERARTSRAWYAEFGRPWAAARCVPLADVALVKLDASASSAAAFAVTAGTEVEVEAARLWQLERPDESFFLDRLAAAVTEQMVRVVAGAVCRAAEAGGQTALFHLSPGCGAWPLEEQGRLLRLVLGEDPTDRLELLESGMLRPVHSMLGLLALSRHAAAPTPKDACGRCDLMPCAFRRAPYRGAT
jgi:hypothetical protein